MSFSVVCQRSKSIKTRPTISMSKNESLIGCVPSIRLADWSCQETDRQTDRHGHKCCLCYSSHYTSLPYFGACNLLCQNVAELLTLSCIFSDGFICLVAETSFFRITRCLWTPWFLRRAPVNAIVYRGFFSWIINVTTNCLYDWLQLYLLKGKENTVSIKISFKS